MLGKMVVLSVLKRPRRTALIMLTIALSVFMMEFVSGWVQGSKDRMNKKILNESPHILVERSERLKSLDPLEPTDLIPKAEAMARGLESDDRVARVEELLRFGALAVSGEKSIGIAVYGIEGGTGFFSQVAGGVVRGSFPWNGPGVAVSVRTLVLIGAPDAKSLTLLVEDAFGAPAYRELPIACVFKTDDSQFDAMTGFVDFATASDLLGVDGASELWMRLKEPNRAEVVRASLLPALESADCSARTWEELQGSLLVMLRMFGFFMIVMNSFVLVVAATVITNAILMNVFEKQGEYGTLRAIGLKKRQQVGLVLAEGGVQGLAGSIVGAVLALPVVLYLQAKGLNIGAASRMFGGGDAMYFGLNPLGTVLDLLFGVLIAISGSLYAAFVGSRATVVDALKGA
jgi:putative ABC transport system permease protein